MVMKGCFCFFTIICYTSAYQHRRPRIVTPTNGNSQNSLPNLPDITFGFIPPGFPINIEMPTATFPPPSPPPSPTPTVTTGTMTPTLFPETGIVFPDFTPNPLVVTPGSAGNTGNVTTIDFTVGTSTVNAGSTENMTSVTNSTSANYTTVTTNSANPDTLAINYSVTDSLSATQVSPASSVSTVNNSSDTTTLSSAPSTVSSENYPAVSIVLSDTMDPPLNNYSMTISNYSVVSIVLSDTTDLRVNNYSTTTSLPSTAQSNARTNPSETSTNISRETTVISKPPESTKITSTDHLVNTELSTSGSMALECSKCTSSKGTEIIVNGNPIISTVPVTGIKIVDGEFTGSIIGVEFPSEMKIYLNITPSITISISTDPPKSVEIVDTAVVETISENHVKLPAQNEKIVAYSTTERAVTESDNNFDLSGPNWGNDFGISSTIPATIATSTTVQTTTSTTTSPPVKNNIFEEKCMQYYNIGSRKTRMAKVQVFIIGGTNSAQKEFPHMAALGYGRNVEQQWLCGGSLISENYVITAAHCLSANNVGDIEFIRLGTTTLQTETLNSEDYNVIRKIPHPNYIQGKQYDDIALLQLEHPVNFSEYIAPICLHSFTDLSGTKLIATGWGKTDPMGDTSLELQKVELDYVPNFICQEGFAGISKEDLPQGIKDDSQICAGSPDGLRDTCLGDSGGPLQLQQDGRMYLVGITSFGIGCGKPGTPGVYTRVSNYIPWIESVVWG